MGLKIGKQNLISQSGSIEDSWEVKKAEVSKGIAKIQDSFEAAESSTPFQGTLFSGPLIGTSIGDAIGDASNNQNEEEQMRDDVQQLQEALSNLERSAKQSNSLFDDDDFYKTIARS